MKKGLLATAFLASLGTVSLIYLSGGLNYGRPADVVPIGDPSMGNADPGYARSLDPERDKGSVRPRLFSADAQSLEPVAPPDQVPPSVGKQAVDETALRYFARQGDQRRLDAEIARLRVLYPDWTPPSDPSAPLEVGDAAMDAMWKLYAEGKFAELRKAIADKENADPAWQAPGDLLARLTLAEAREQLINASNLKQFETVIRTASQSPSLLTCAEVDVMWRLAEAFAETGRHDRARDAYKYVLENCTGANERLATIEKAIPLLPRPLLTELFALERTLPDGSREFETSRLSMSRKLVADAGAEPTLSVPESDLDALKAVAQTSDGSASDAELLGWYYIRRANPEEAETWFTRSRDQEDTALSSEGLALAKIALDKPNEAENILYRWRNEKAEIRQVYMAAVANYLAIEPRISIPPEILARMAQAVADARDPAAAQQFGWYARDLNQHQTAAQWFATALQWKPDDEPSAYGLVLTRNLLGDRAGVRDIQRAWAGRSQRIASLGEPRRQRQQNRNDTAQGDVIARSNQERPSIHQGEISTYTTDRQIGTVEASPQAYAGSRIDSGSPRLAPNAVLQDTSTQSNQVTREPPVASRVDRRSERRNCAATMGSVALVGEAALARGWCLSDLNRPMEAVEAFQRALDTGNSTVQREAAWGQALAYLSRNMVDDAAISAAKAPQDSKRARQLEVEILTQRALGFYEQKRYNEALLALDQRNRIAPERMDLMSIRGYAYLNLRRLGDAEKVFRAMAAVGHKEGFRGLAILRETRRLP